MTMKILYKFGIIAIGLIAFAPTALAASPNLSLSGNGDNITLSVSNADYNSQVEIDYISPGSSLVTKISNPNFVTSGGYFSTAISAANYGITSGSQVFVTVNGQESNRVNYPSGYN